MPSPSKYTKLIVALIEKLGGECTECHTSKRLQIHHVNKKDYLSRNLNSEARAKLYLDEHTAGVPLKVLCIKCHRRIHGTPYPD